MLCQSCKKRQANTHIKQTINGETHEYILCDKCAESFGYGNVFNNFSLNLNDFLGSLFTQALPSSTHINYNTKHCKRCGSSIEDISKSGTVGCAECYKTFYDELIPSIGRIHGQTEHTGKISVNDIDKENVHDKLDKLQNDLEKSIRNQEFERAAKLRDKINELKKEGAK